MLYVDDTVLYLQAQTKDEAAAILSKVKSQGSTSVQNFFHVLWSFLLFVV